MPGLIEFETTSTAAPLKTGSGPEPEDEGALLAGTQTIAHLAPRTRGRFVSRDRQAAADRRARRLRRHAGHDSRAFRARRRRAGAGDPGGNDGAPPGGDLRRGLPCPHRKRSGGRHLTRHRLHRRDGGDLRVGSGRRRRRGRAASRRGDPSTAGRPHSFNTSVYALGAAAGAVCAGVPNEGFGWLALEVTLASTAFYAVNIPLVVAVVSRWAREGFLQLLRRATASTFAAFAIMASLTLMLAVLWERSPFLSAALVGPLAAIALYQRSVHRAGGHAARAHRPAHRPRQPSALSRAPRSRPHRGRGEAPPSASACSTSTTSRS